MRSTPEIDARLRERLRQAVDKFANGSADKFGQLIGYANGGYVREILGAKQKPVRETLIQRIHAVPEMAGWFDGLVTPMMAPEKRGDLVLSPAERALVLAFRQQLADHQSPNGPSRKRRAGDR